MVELKIYKKQEVSLSATFKQVDKLAKQLLAELNKPETFKKITQANLPGTSSAQIQNAFLPVVTKMGFKNEAKGLFSNYQNKHLRPDYFLDLSNNEGILLEVERGKTTINNMDLLDFWKCHICEHANYLFLMVPKELRQNKQMSPRKEFNTVSARMNSFFLAGNYTNVNGVFLYGY